MDESGVATWPPRVGGPSLVAGSDRNAASFAAAHFGQYHGAGVFTGRGLRLWHVAQRYRLPLIAVLGRYRFPVRGMFFMIVSAAGHL